MIVLYFQVKELGLPLKHNKLSVMRFFTLIRDDDRYWCKDLLTEERDSLRWKILTLKVKEQYNVICTLMKKFFFCRVMLTLAYITC